MYRLKMWWWIEAKSKVVCKLKLGDYEGRAREIMGDDDEGGKLTVKLIITIHYICDVCKLRHTESHTAYFSPIPSKPSIQAKPSVELTRSTNLLNCYCTRR